MKKYKILAIDGGGVRGILPAKLIERLSQLHPHIIEETDLFVGTSAGSYIALGLASGLTPGQIVQWFKSQSPIIFKSPRWFHFTKPKYKNDRLIKAVNKAFGKKKLQDLSKKVVVPSFSLAGDTKPYWAPIFFNNFEGSVTRQVKVADAALSSSAAPTYFPSYNKRIDGGVYANNPSTVGLAFATSNIGGQQPIENVVLFSIGTGFFPYQITQDTMDWGELEWIGAPWFYKRKNKNAPDSPLLDVIFDGVSQVDATITSMFLKDHYFRLNPALNTPVQLDDYKRIPELLQIGENASLTEALAFLETHYK